MGGGNSVEAVTNSLVESISSSVTSSMQQASDTTLSSQSINLNCDDALKIVTAAWQKCYADLAGGKDITQLSTQQAHNITEICKQSYQSYTCEIDHLSIQNSIVLKDASTITTSLKSTLESKIIASLTNRAQQYVPVGGFDETLKSTIKSTAETISTSVIDSAATLLDNNVHAQQIMVNSGQLSYVTVSDMSSVVKNTVLNTTAASTAIADLAATIVQTAGQSGGGMGVIWIIVASVLGLLAVLVLVLIIVHVAGKRRTGSKPTGGVDIHVTPSVQ